MFPQEAGLFRIPAGLAEIEAPSAAGHPRCQPGRQDPARRELGDCAFALSKDPSAPGPAALRAGMTRPHGSAAVASAPLPALPRIDDEDAHRGKVGDVAGHDTKSVLHRGSGDEPVGNTDLASRPAGRRVKIAPQPRRLGIHGENAFGKTALQPIEPGYELAPPGRLSRAEPQARPRVSPGWCIYYRPARRRKRKMDGIATLSATKSAEAQATQATVESRKRSP